MPYGKAGIDMYIQTTTFHPHLSPPNPVSFPILTVSETTEQLEICQMSSLIDLGINVATRSPSGWVRNPTIFWKKVEPLS